MFFIKKSTSLVELYIFASMKQKIQLTTAFNSLNAIIIELQIRIDYYIQIKEINCCCPFGA